MFFYADKEKFYLVHDPPSLAVRTDVEPSNGVLEEIVDELRSVLPGLQTAEQLSEWTLFALPNSSSAASDPLAGGSILQSIATLAANLGDKYFFSPVLGPPDSHSVVNGKIIVRFEEDVLQPFAEEVLEEAGIEIGEQHFAGTHNVYRGTLNRARSGLEVLDVSNELALLDFVRWSEPSFTQFGSASGAPGGGGGSAPPEIPAQRPAHLVVLSAVVALLAVWRLRQR